MTAGGVTHNTRGGKTSIAVYATKPIARLCQCERDQSFKDPITGDVSCLACGRPPADAPVSPGDAKPARPAGVPARGRNRRVSA